MALAALMTSPLMPWPEAWAQAKAPDACAAPDGVYLPSEATDDDYRLLNLLRRPVVALDKLRGRLMVLLDLLMPNGPETPAQQQFQVVVKTVLAELADCDEIPWTRLLAQTEPRPQVEDLEGPLVVEGGPVFSERKEPWCRVKHLFVLGYSEGRYPSTRGRSAVFTEQEVAAISTGGLPALETSKVVRSRARRLFMKQLQAARETVTFTIPLRDESGGECRVSESLVFMASNLQLPLDYDAGEGRPCSAEDLVKTLELASDRRGVRWLSEAPVPPEEAVSPAVAEGKLDLERDLISAFVDGEGEVRTFSPTDLEQRTCQPISRCKGGNHFPNATAERSEGAGLTSLRLSPPQSLCYHMLTTELRFT